jgi:hypothetical protein
MKKQKDTRPLFLAILILACVIVSPLASAVEYHSTTFPGYTTKTYYGEDVTHYDYDASAENLRIALIYFKTPQEGRIDITFYYGNGSSISGFTENHRDPSLLWTNVTVSLNGVSDSYHYADLNQFYDSAFSGYAMDDNATPNSGFLLASTEYGLLDNDLAVFYPVPQLGRNLITRVVVTGDKPFSVEVVAGDPADVAEGVKRSTFQTVQEWIDFAFGLGGSLIGFLLGTLFFIKFLFVDNLILIIALYLSVTMAYAAISSRNIFDFYKRFFKMQRSLITFMMEIWNYLIQILAAFRGIFRI